MAPGTDESLIAESGLFDGAYYGRAAGVKEEDAAAHYLAKGKGLDFDPHPLFRSRYYFLQCADLDLEVESPLAHYLRKGAARGLSPHPLFNAHHYASQFEFCEDVPLNPLVHYLRGWARRPEVNPHA
jgi:hypothetical protein